MATKKKPDESGSASFALKQPTLHERLLAADAALVDAAENYDETDARSLRQLRACAIDYARTADEVDDLEEGK